MKQARSVLLDVNEHLFMNKNGASFIVRELIRENNFQVFIINEFAEFECLDPEILINYLAILTDRKKIIYIGKL